MRILAQAKHIKYQAKHTWQKLYNYMRYDFKEIVFPSALPNPPGTKEARKLSWDEHVLVWKVAIRVYIKSFKTPDIDIEEEFELVKNPGKAKPKKEKKVEHVEPSTIEDLAVAAKAGSEHIRPALHRLYMTKASAYRDALKNFVEGYQEGLTEVLSSVKMSEPRSNNAASDTKVDSPETKATEVKPDAKADTTTSNSDWEASGAKPETKPSEIKKGENI